MLCFLIAIIEKRRADSDDDVLQVGQRHKTNRHPYDVVLLPQILPSDDNLPMMRRFNTATLEYLEQAGMRAVISSTVTRAFQGRQSATETEDGVASDIEFVVDE